MVELGRYLAEDSGCPPSSGSCQGRARASAAALDSQSVKTGLGGKERGIHGGKKVQGRKRQILVDSLGFLIAVVVSAANVDDARAAQDIFAQVHSETARQLARKIDSARSRVLGGGLGTGESVIGDSWSTGR